ncbi:MAG: hypothetical protein B7Z73_07265 [Planctomycetia bacterium 21-64-5]|nr:MAG: hypothetical protein B7Z73_07265 [Planctomycetia bacterium 21-64-5]
MLVGALHRKRFDPRPQLLKLTLLHFKLGALGVDSLVQRINGNRRIRRRFCRSGQVLCGLLPVGRPRAERKYDQRKRAEPVGFVAHLYLDRL